MPEGIKKLAGEWGQPVLTGIVLLAVGWVGESVTNVREDVAEVDRKFAVLSQQLESQRRLVNRRLDQFNNRVSDLEERVQDVEDGAIATAVRKEMERSGEAEGSE